MKFCKHCGKEMEDTATTCPHCGGFCQAQTPAPAQVNPPISVNQETASTGGLSKAAMILGGIGVVAAWLLALLGYIFGGAALAMAIVAKNKGDQKAKSALIVSVIALACSVISSIIGVIAVLG